jgi:3-hydroxybutyryl-CoA dehydrogenase
MGHGIAIVFARAGIRTRVWDVSREAIRAGEERVRKSLAVFGSVGMNNSETAGKTSEHIAFTTDLEQAVKDADFITESVVEDLAVKGPLLAKTEAISKEETIIASNTSSIPITALSDHLARPDRFLLTHYFNPAYILPCVEVAAPGCVPGEVVDAVINLLKSIGKIPVRIEKIVPGLVVNRVQAAMFRELLALVEHGVATVEDIDTLIRYSTGLRLVCMGPLRMADMGGLDVWNALSENLFPEIESGRDVPPVLREKIAQGKLGVKSGEGFYKYADDIGANAVAERDWHLLGLLKNCIAGLSGGKSGSSI